MNSTDSEKSAHFSGERLKFSLIEFSGGLGDLGTFIPLTVGVALVSEMDLSVILIWAGLFNIFAGIFFGLPIPVQPMKSIAAVVIAEQLAPGEIAAAGILVGALVFLFGATGWMKAIGSIVPLSIVRGIQLGVGIKLGLTGLRYISETELFALDGGLAAILLGGLTLALNGIRKFPAAVVMLVCGIAIVAVGERAILDFVQPGLPAISFSLPAGGDWSSGLWRGALPQFPLTVLNSVIAICALSGDLFPGRKVPLNRMAVSVGLMNLVSVPFGAMPMCHGSGGLAGQHYFGARSGGSVVMLGGLKIILALTFGAGLMQLLQAFPQSILGIMLVFAGIELALPARDQNKRADFLVTALTATGIVALNTGIGFVIGLCAVLIGRLANPTRPR